MLIRYYFLFTDKVTKQCSDKANTDTITCYLSNWDFYRFKIWRIQIPNIEILYYCKEIKHYIQKFVLWYSQALIHVDETRGCLHI